MSHLDSVCVRISQDRSRKEINDVAKLQQEFASNNRVKVKRFGEHGATEETRERGECRSASISLRRKFLKARFVASITLRVYVIFVETFHLDNSGCPFTQGVATPRVAQR